MGGAVEYFVGLDYNETNFIGVVDAIGGKE